MRNNLVFFPVILIFFLNMSAHGQAKSSSRFDYTGGEFKEKIDDFIINKKSYSAFLGNYMNKKFTKGKSLCTQGVIYAKFVVRKGSKIEDLSLTKTSDTLVAQYFRKAIQESEKYWKGPQDGVSEQFLLPIHYSYHQGCQVSELAREYYPNILFDDGTKLDFLSCFVLTPHIHIINAGQETVIQAR